MADNASAIAVEMSTISGVDGSKTSEELTGQLDMKEQHTPSDVIVQQQLRDFIVLQNATLESLHQNVTVQETFIKENLVSKEEHMSKMREFEQSLKENFVCREEYDAVLQQLEREQQLHGQTKLKLMEVMDRLDFMLAETDILNRQLGKEKEAFQQLADSLKSQIAKGKNWNEELQAKYAASHQRCQELEGRLASREATISALEVRLQQQQIVCEHKVEELQVERQQDQYVARMLDQPSHCGRKNCAGTKFTNGHRLK